MIEYENLAKLNAPFFKDLEQAFKTTLEGGWYILGQEVKKFEDEYAHFQGAAQCVGVASGLDALTLSLMVLELPPKSEVIVPSNTYIATILSILQAGHVPVLVEPDLATYNIDPAKIREKISSKTKALMIVHLYGKCCDMDPIMALVKEHDLFLIEDVAQAHGAKYKGKMAGTFGHLSAFSYYPTKNLGALGDAGAVVTDSAEYAQKIRTLRNYGSKVKYYNEVVGMNSRLDEVQASFLRVKLRKLDAINEHKRMLGALYHSKLGNHVIKPQQHPDYFDVFHIYNIRHQKRDQLREHLLQQGVKTEVHYPVSPNQQQAMKGLISDLHCPISEEIHRTTLSLPISYFHTREDVLKVVEAVNSFRAN